MTEQIDQAQELDQLFRDRAWQTITIKNVRKSLMKTRAGIDIAWIAVMTFLLSALWRNPRSPLRTMSG